MLAHATLADKSRLTRYASLYCPPGPFPDMSHNIICGSGPQSALAINKPFDEHAKLVTGEI